jgi:hypothetical protein
MLQKHLIELSLLIFERKKVANVVNVFAVCYSRLHYMLRSQEEISLSFLIAWHVLPRFCFMYLSLCTKRVTSFVGIRRQLEKKILYDFCTKLFILHANL